MIESLNLNERIRKLERKEQGVQSIHEKEKARKKIYKEVSKIIVKHLKEIELTALPAIKLYLYNFIAKNPKATEKESEKAFTKINLLSEKENKYSQESNFLPTIGIEIEVPRTNLTPEKREILYGLNVPNDSEGSNLWEVNPHFSYSPWVQAQIIQELAEMDALPLEKIEGNPHKKIPSYTPLSLHVSFGMPKEIINKILVQNTYEVSLLNDTLIYAFTSPNRIDNRKTTDSSYFKDDAQPSKKNEDKNYTNKKSSDMYSDNSEVLLRLELRAFEFKDYPTYRMLAESQRLMAMLISYLKTYVDHNKIDSKELELAMLWKKFENEIKNLFDQFKLSPEMIDHHHGKIKVMEILKTTDLKDRCRNTVTKYSKEVSKIIKTKEKN